MVGIYKITSPTGNVYIGQSWNIEKRFYDYHKCLAANQPALNNSFNKYGIESHSFEVIHELPIDAEQEVLNRYEQLYMDAHRDCGIALLNVKEGGSNGKHAESTKKKIQESLKGRRFSTKHQEKITKAITGKPKSDQHRQSLRNANLGKKTPAIVKQKLSASMKRAWEINPRGENYIIKLSAALKGRTFTNTHKENISSGRKELGSAKGINNPRAILTPELVKQIRNKFKPRHYTGKMLATEYGVSYQTIRDILDGRRWQHVA